MLTPPEEIMKEKRCTLTYRALNLVTTRISIATEDVLIKALESLQEGIVFYTRGKKFGAVEVRFAIEELVAKHAVITLKTDEHLGHEL